MGDAAEGLGRVTGAGGRGWGLHAFQGAESLGCSRRVSGPEGALRWGGGGAGAKVGFRTELRGCAGSEHQGGPPQQTPCGRPAGRLCLPFFIKRVTRLVPRAGKSISLSFFHATLVHKSKPVGSGPEGVARR